MAKLVNWLVDTHYHYVLWHTQVCTDEEQVERRLEAAWRHQ